MYIFDSFFRRPKNLFTLWNQLKYSTGDARWQYRNELISEDELVSSYVRIGDKLINLISAVSENDLITITRNVLQFVDANLIPFLSIKKFSFFVGKLAHFLIISLKRCLENDENYLKFINLCAFAYIAEYMGLSPDLSFFVDFYRVFPDDKIKRILNDVTLPGVDRYFKVYFIVLFSATSKGIPVEYTYDILETLNTCKIEFRDLDKNLILSYLRAMNKLLVKIDKFEYVNFLRSNNFKLHKKFLNLIQQLYKFNSSKKRSFRRIFRLLVTITTFFRSVIMYGTVYDMPNYFYDIYADTFLKAINLLEKKSICNELYSEMFIPDYFENEERPIYVWIGMMKNMISVMFIRCCFIFKNDFENCLKKEKYKPILEFTGYRL